MFMLGVHYSNPITYEDGAIDGAARGWERLYNAVRLTRRAMNTAQAGSGDGNAILEVIAKARADFGAAMDDDFTAPLAIASLQEFTREVNTLLNSGVNIGLDVLNAIHDAYTDLGGKVLGIIPQHESASGDGAREAALVELLITMRAEARAKKNWAESDRIRDELAKAGVILEDRADGTIWKTS